MDLAREWPLMEGMGQDQSVTEGVGSDGKARHGPVLEMSKSAEEVKGQKVG